MLNIENLGAYGYNIERSTDSFRWEKTYDQPIFSTTGSAAYFISEPTTKGSWFYRIVLLDPSLDTNFVSEHSVPWTEEEIEEVLKFYYSENNRVYREGIRNGYAVNTATLDLSEISQRELELLNTLEGLPSEKDSFIIEDRYRVDRFNQAQRNAAIIRVAKKFWGPEAGLEKLPWFTDTMYGWIELELINVGGTIDYRSLEEIDELFLQKQVALESDLESLRAEKLSLAISKIFASKVEIDHSTDLQIFFPISRPSDSDDELFKSDFRRSLDRSEELLNEIYEAQRNLRLWVRTPGPDSQAATLLYGDFASFQNWESLAADYDAGIFWAKYSYQSASLRRWAEKYAAWKSYQSRDVKIEQYTQDIAENSTSLEEEVEDLKRQSELLTRFPEHYITWASEEKSRILEIVRKDYEERISGISSTKPSTWSQGQWEEYLRENRDPIIQLYQEKDAFFHERFEFLSNLADEAEEETSLRYAEIEQYAEMRRLASSSELVRSVDEFFAKRSNQGWTFFTTLKNRLEGLNDVRKSQEYLESILNSESRWDGLIAELTQKLNASDARMSWEDYFEFLLRRNPNETKGEYQNRENWFHSEQKRLMGEATNSFAHHQLNEVIGSLMANRTKYSEAIENSLRNLIYAAHANELAAYDAMANSEVFVGNPAYAEVDRKFYSEQLAIVQEARDDYRERIEESILRLFQEEVEVRNDFQSTLKWMELPSESKKADPLYHQILLAQGGNVATDSIINEIDEEIKMAGLASEIKARTHMLVEKAEAHWDPEEALQQILGTLKYFASEKGQKATEEKNRTRSFQYHYDLYRHDPDVVDPETGEVISYYRMARKASGFYGGSGSQVVDQPNTETRPEDLPTLHDFEMLSDESSDLVVAAGMISELGIGEVEDFDFGLIEEILSEGDLEDITDFVLSQGGYRGLFDKTPLAAARILYHSLRINYEDILGGLLKYSLDTRLLPVDVVELSPRVRDEEGREIIGSEIPNEGLPLTPFVKIDPSNQRIAHRELKVRVGKMLRGKTVIWSLEALKDGDLETIRGNWSNSLHHSDRFEASISYGSSGFKRINNEVAETTIDENGNTSVRVNVPPIGLNRVKVKLQIKGFQDSIDLINMEVPAVVVIDPGHGGFDPGAIARRESSVEEADLALVYGLELKREIIEMFGTQGKNLRVFMTRESDVYVQNSERAKMARQEGADVFVSVHFNSAENRTARGTEYLNRTNDQVNSEEDERLGENVQAATLNAILAFDADGTHRDPKYRDLAVLSDTYYGNTSQFHPVRGTLIEVEFLSNEGALDSIRLPGERGNEIKLRFAENVASSIYSNIVIQK